jgi:peptide/nickel transport system ATP-binding protein
MEEPKSLLKITDLILKFYTYEGVVEALDEVRLELRDGETLGLVGETGCGKSVTGLSTLVLVPPPGRIEGGKIIFKKKDKRYDLLAQREEFLRSLRGKDVSMIFQDPRSALNPVYTVRDQIVEVLMRHKRVPLCKKVLSRNDLSRYERYLYTRLLTNPRSFTLRILSKIPLANRFRRRINKVARDEAINMLKAMRIPDPERVMEMYPHELSGGMAQRTVIAMALACSPTLLIADEPTTNLDVTVQLQILNLIRELKKEFGSSILYITHDMGVVAELCDRVAVMYAGSVVETADVVEVFKKPLHPYTRGLLGSIPRVGVPFKSIEGTVPSLINPPKGCRFNDRCPYAMYICSQVKPKMMEVKKEHFVECFLYSKGPS